MIKELKYEEMTRKIVKNQKNFEKQRSLRIGDWNIKVEKEEVTGKGEITKMKR